MKIRTRGRVRTSWVAGSLALLATAAPAEAARKPISGKLSKPGYTVIALAANGKARAMRVGSREFRLVPPAKQVTLHLRGRNGVYAGPIVVGREKNGKLAIVGVKAGSKLGRIRVGKGYANVTRRLPKGSLDSSRKARAKKGVPIGARKFGRVRSRRPRGPDADRDLDGIPSPIDIDDDGDLILDNLDRSSGPRASVFATIFNPFSQLTLYLDTTVNANVSAVTTDQIDLTLSRFGSLIMGVLPGDTAELDCGGASQSPARPEGLVYCSYGGTGTMFGQPFPECCDPDGDGFGALTSPGVLGGTFLEHGARTDQIGTGDVLFERVTTGGVETLFPATLQFVFATVPTLVAFSDGVGPPRTVSYPVYGHPTPARCPPDCRGPDQGIRGNGFPVAARPAGDPAAGDVVLTFAFWRPQRSRIPGDPQPQAGESAEWIDIGGLVYTAGISDIGAFCPQSAFSETDDELAPASGPIHRPGAGGFADSAASRPAKATNTFTYTLNVTQCLAANGLSPWNPGEERGLALSGLAPNTADEAQLGVFFKRTP